METVYMAVMLFVVEGFFSPSLPTRSRQCQTRTKIWTALPDGLLPKTAHIFNILLPPHSESGAAMLIDAYDMNITKCAMTEDVKQAASVIHAD